jgi:hypothetical protein
MSETENIKQAVVLLAHASSSIIGTSAYFSICDLLYPENAPHGFKPTEDRSK